MATKNIQGELTVNGSKVITEDTLPEGDNFSGSYNDLSNKPDIPSKVSDLENDKGYLTSFTETDPTVPNHVKGISESDISAWNAKSNFSGSYNDLSNKPDIDDIKDRVDVLVGGYSKGLSYALQGETYKVNGMGTCTDTDIIIQKIYNGKPVTSIGANAFYGCTNLESIVIPDSVTSIGSSAFRGCTGLTSVIIPDSVKSIDTFVFYGCTNLKSIVIPNSVTSIGSYAFTNCSSLIGIVIPNTVTNLGPTSFSGCTNLESIVIPNSITTINVDTFVNCTNLRSIVIPDSVTSIGDRAFRACTNLRSIVIPDSLTSIGEDVFRGCTNLRSIVIPSSVISIGTAAFYGCTNLESIVIPDSVTSIGRGIVNNCDKTKITIYCGVGSKLEGWDDNWNYLGATVVWNYATDIYSLNKKISDIMNALNINL